MLAWDALCFRYTVLIWLNTDMDILAVRAVGNEPFRPVAKLLLNSPAVGDRIELISSLKMMERCLSFLVRITLTWHWKRDHFQVNKFTYQPRQA